VCLLRRQNENSTIQQSYRDCARIIIIIIVIISSSSSISSCCTAPYHVTPDVTLWMASVVAVGRCSICVASSVVVTTTTSRGKPALLVKLARLSADRALTPSACPPVVSRQLPQIAAIRRRQMYYLVPSGRTRYRVTSDDNDGDENWSSGRVHQRDNESSQMSVAPEFRLAPDLPQFYTLKCMGTTVM